MCNPTQSGSMSRGLCRPLLTIQYSPVSQLWTLPPSLISRRASSLMVHWIGISRLATGRLYALSLVRQARRRVRRQPRDMGLKWIALAPQRFNITLINSIRSCSTRLASEPRAADSQHYISTVGRAVPRTGRRSFVRRLRSCAVMILCPFSQRLQDRSSVRSSRPNGSSGICAGPPRI